MSPRPANATQRRYLWRKMRRVICADGITTTRFLPRPNDEWRQSRSGGWNRFNGEKSGPRFVSACILLLPPEISSPDYKIMPRRSVHKFALEILICRWRIVKLGPSTRLETLSVFVIIDRWLFPFFLLVVKIFFFLWFDRITIVDDYKLVFCNFPYAISNHRYARNNFLRNLFSTCGWISEIIRSREL